MTFTTRILFAAVAALALSPFVLASDPPVAMIPPEPPAAVVESSPTTNPLDACVSVWQARPDAFGATHGGSGFCFRSENSLSWVMTNNHVVSPGRNAYGGFTSPAAGTPVVVKHAGKSYPGEVLAADDDLDVAVVGVKGSLPAVALADLPAKPGATVTRNGIGSGFQRGTVLQHNPAYLSPSMHFIVRGQSESGDSGSAYFDSEGQVVAIHCGKDSVNPRGTPITPIRNWLKKKFGERLASDGPPAAKAEPKNSGGLAGRGLCVCGDGCKCKPGSCPGACPVAQPPAVTVYREEYHRDARGRVYRVLVPASGPGSSPCPNGRCPLQR